MDVKVADKLFYLTLVACFASNLIDIFLEWKWGGVILTRKQIATYEESGILVWREQFFNPEEWEKIKVELDIRLNNRSSHTKAEEVRNLHTSDDFIMRLTSHPKVIQVVTDLLGGNSDIKIFATRLLCKLPKIGVTIPWHQDSRYYTLNDPKMVNFWIAVDDVSPENGAMNMINYTALPESRQNLPLVRDNRGGFPNSIDPNYIKDEDVMVMDLKSGEAEFHDGFIAHGSPPNLSDKRRCAWIARYVPGHVKLVGKQMLPHIYNEDYKIVPILKL